MKKITKSLLFISFMALASCSSDEPASPSPDASNCESDIVFVQTGKTFSYKMSQLGLDAGILKLTIGECNGAGFLVSRQNYDVWGVLTTNRTDIWKQNGDFLLSDSNSNGDYFSKLYKKNAGLGETWSVQRPDGSVVTHEVVDIDSLVTVPAGSFHCKVYKYTTTSTINESYVFWNDAIGNVREDAGFLLLELISHN